MIQPSELRIGNLVYNRHNEVTEVDLYDLKQMCQPRMDGHGYSGIPLTESHFEGVNGLTVKWSFKGRAEISMCGIPITVIEYLHEWQNLYYLLFGSELEVKP